MKIAILVEGKTELAFKSHLLKHKRRYKKPRDARRILRDKDLLISAIACPELKAFLNRILQLCEGDLIP
jgi:hypothetical protein